MGMEITSGTDLAGTKSVNVGLSTDTISVSKDLGATHTGHTGMHTDIGISTGSMDVSKGLDVTKTDSTGTHHRHIDAHGKSGFVDMKTGDREIQASASQLGIEVQGLGRNAKVDTFKVGMRDAPLDVVQSPAQPSLPVNSIAAVSSLEHAHHANTQDATFAKLDPLMDQASASQIGNEAQGLGKDVKVDTLQSGIGDAPFVNVEMITGDIHNPLLIQGDVLGVYSETLQPISSDAAFNTAQPSLPVNSIKAVPSMDHIHASAQDVPFAKLETMVDQRMATDAVSLGTFPQPETAAGSLKNVETALSSSDLLPAERALAVDSIQSGDTTYRPVNSGPLHPDEPKEKSHHNKTKKTEKTVQQVTTKNITLPSGHQVVETKTKTVEVKVTETTNLSAEKNTAAVSADGTGTASDQKVAEVHPDHAVGASNEIVYHPAGEAKLPVNIGLDATATDPAIVSSDQLGPGNDQPFPEIHIDTSIAAGAGEHASGFETVVDTALNGILHDKHPRESAKASHEVRSLKDSIDPLMQSANAQPAIDAAMGVGKLDASAMDVAANGEISSFSEAPISKDKKRRKGKGRKKGTQADVKMTSRKKKINISHGTSNKVVNEIDLSAAQPDPHQTDVAFIIVDRDGQSSVSAIKALGQTIHSMTPVESVPSNGMPGGIAPSHVPSIETLGQTIDHIHPVESAPSNIRPAVVDHSTDPIVLGNVAINPIDTGLSSIEIIPENIPLGVKTSDTQTQEGQRKPKRARKARRKSRRGKSRNVAAQVPSGDLGLRSGSSVSETMANIRADGHVTAFQGPEILKDPMHPSQSASLEPLTVRGDRLPDQLLPVGASPMDPGTALLPTASERDSIRSKRRQRKSRRRQGESSTRDGVSRNSKSGRRKSSRDRITKSTIGVSDMTGSLEHAVASFGGDIGPADPRQSIQEIRSSRDSSVMQDTRFPTRQSDSFMPFSTGPPMNGEIRPQSIGLADDRSVDRQQVLSPPKSSMAVPKSLRTDPDTRRRMEQEIREELESLQSLQRQHGQIAADPPRAGDARLATGRPRVRATHLSTVRPRIGETRQAADRPMVGDARLATDRPRVGTARLEGDLASRGSMDRQSGRLIIGAGGTQFNPSSGFSAAEDGDRLGDTRSAVFEPGARGRYQFSSGGVVGVPDNLVTDLRTMTADPRARGRYHFTAGGAIGIPDVSPQYIDRITPGFTRLRSPRGRDMSNERIIGHLRNGRPVYVYEPQDSSALRDSRTTPITRGRVSGGLSGGRRAMGRSSDGRPIYVSDLGDRASVGARTGLRDMVRPLSRETGRKRGEGFERRIVRLPQGMDGRSTPRRRTAAAVVDRETVKSVRDDRRRTPSSTRDETIPRRARTSTASGRGTVQRTSVGQKRVSRPREFERIPQRRESRARGRAEMDARVSVLGDRDSARSRVSADQRPRRPSARVLHARQRGRIEGDTDRSVRTRIRSLSERGDAGRPSRSRLRSSAGPVLDPRSQTRSRTRSMSNRRHVISARGGDVDRLRAMRLRGDTSTPDAARRIRRIRLGRFGSGDVVGPPVTIGGDRYVPVEVPYTFDGGRIFPDRARFDTAPEPFRGLEMSRSSPMLAGRPRTMYPMPRSSGPFGPLPPPYSPTEYLFR